MPNTFLDQISIYNAKASLAITEAVKQENVEKANLMSALKSTANDLTLSTTTRLTALTALINIGDLLEKALPPYFPITVTYENLQKYAGIHNDLDGLDQGNYLHLTVQEKSTLFAKASVTDITWGNLQGDYTQNIAFAALFDQKQQQLNGVGLVRANGTNITYDNTTYLTTASLATTAAGGGLTGFYPNPGLSNSAVINQTLTGFNPLGPTGTITSADTIVSAIQKLNANLLNVGSGVGTISSISFSMPSNVFNYTAGPYTSGAAPLSATFKSQAQNSVFAGPTSGGTGQPDFRALVTADLPASPTPTGTFGSASTIPVITVDAYGRVTNIANVTSASGGQVNTVTMAVPAGGVFTAVNGGTPSAVQLGFGLGNQSPNTVWAGPASGSATAPGFRALVAADIPTGIPQANISNLTAALNAKLGAGLNTSLIYMGNGSGIAAQTIVSGDLQATYSEPSGVNTATFTIKNGAVTYAKFANVPDSALNTIRPILLGRFSAGQGVMEQMTLSGDFTLNPISGEIGLLTPNPPSLNDAGDLLTSSGANILERLSLPVDYATKGYLLVPYVGTTAPDIKLMWGEAKGDITYSIDTTTTPGTPFPNFVIGANKVTLSKIQTIATNTILGNNAVGAAIPAELTPANVVAMLPLQDAVTGTTKGVVPASSFTPAAGKTKQDYFLAANNTWQLGVGGTTLPGGNDLQIQWNDGGSFGGLNNMATDNGSNTFVTTGTFGIVDDANNPNNGVYISVPNVTGGALTWAIPAINASDTFVGEAFTQTLTNKTLSTGTAIDVGSPAIGTMWYDSDGAGTLAEIDPTGGSGKFLSLDGSNVPYWTGVTISSVANLSGGAANQVPYQTAPSTTGFITAPTVDGIYILSQTRTTGTVGAPTWIGTTGTGNVVLATSPTMDSPYIGTTATTGHIHFRKAAASIPSGFANTATLWFPETGVNKKMAIMWDNLGYASEFQLDATATQTYIFPNASGTVALINSTQLLSVAASGGNSGKISLGGSTSGTITLQAPATVTGAGVYTLPNAYPTGANQFLTATTGGAMSWVSITGSGNVVGPASSTTGNFAVYADTSGTLLADSTIVRLIGGAMTIGTSGTQGSLIFNDGTTANTVTLRASNNTGATSYIFPTSNGSNTNVLTLSNAATGQLAWSSAGTGDITRAGTNQVVTGNITFSQSALIFRNTDATRTATMSLLATTGGAASYTVTLQQASGTVALLESNQSWSGTQTFQANVTLGTGSYNATLLDFTGTTSNRIQFAAGPVSAPNTGATAPVGTRITVANTRTSLLADFTIGMASSTEMYLGSSGSTTAISNTEISFYNKTNKSGAFVAGGLNLSSTGQSAPGISEGAISPQLNIAAGATNWYSSGNAASYIRFWTSVSAAPTNQNTRSTGTRIVLQPNLGVGSVDAAIGYNDTEKETWLTGAQTGTTEGKISFYSSITTSALYRVGYFGNSGLVFDGTTSNSIATGITFSNSGNINWGTSGSAAPSNGNTRPAGTKLVLRANVAVNSSDYAIGVDSANYETWITGGSTATLNGGMIGFWVGLATAFKRTVWITENALNLAASTNIITNSTSIDVVNTTATTVNFAGAATTLAIGNTATAAQTVNMFTASTGASTYNFATGATANATTKTINIGTGGAAGSTTNITLGTSTTTNLRFFGSANTSGKPTVTGSRSGGAAITNLLTALSNLGLITDSTTA